MSELSFLHENIFGIYNYCDRWCEKCSYTNRCLLFKKEAERNIKHILNDEDPNNPEVFAKDISDNFKEVFDLLSKEIDNENDSEYLDEDEFDFDDSENELENMLEHESEDDEGPSASLRKIQNPLIDMTEDLFKDFYKYYNLLKSIFPEEFDEKNPDNYLHKNLEILAWYTPQISVKTKMCFWGKSKLLKAKNEIQKEVEKEIFNVNCAIAFSGIKNCLSALSNLYKLKLEVQSETLLLLTTTKQIKEIFVTEFPTVLTYKRPYFD